MKYIIIAMLSVSIGATVFAGETNVVGKTYSFTIPDHVIFESHEEMEFYTFRWGPAPQLALFMLNVNPAPLSPQALKPMADMMEIAFEDQMKKQGQAADMQKKRTELELGLFKGTELEFVIKHPAGMTLQQYMFLLHDGELAWNGQLTATSTNDIATAHAILQKAKKTPKEETDDE